MKAMLQSIKRQWAYLPTGANYLLYTEICELYGRFGVFALLVLYLTHVLHLSDAKAFGLYAAFVTLQYALPMMGGYVADRCLGAVPAVVLGILLMMGGSVFLVVPHLTDVTVGLMLMVVGGAVFTPTLMGILHHLYGGRPEDHDTGFMLYYLARNVGALLAPLVGGFLAVRFGYGAAFIVNLVVMASGLWVFYRGRRSFKLSDKDSLLAGSGRFALKRLGFYLLAMALAGLLAWGLDWLVEADLTVTFLLFAVLVALFLLFQIMHSGALSKNVLGQMLLVFVLAAVFNVFLWQGGTTLSLFIDRMVDRQIFGVTLPTAFFYTLNPLFMLTAGPVLFMALKRVMGVVAFRAALKKMGIGLALLAAGFGVFTLAAWDAYDMNVSVLYVVLAYLIFPLAELAMMPVALSFVSQHAPSGRTATLVGFLTLGTAIASYATGWLSSLGSVSGVVVSHEQMVSHYSFVFGLSASALAAVAGMVLLGLWFTGRAKTDDAVPSKKT